MNHQDKLNSAFQVAHKYYVRNMKTEHIANEMNVSRSTVSRLLSFAKDEGLVNIHIIDPNEEPSRIEKEILDRFSLKKIHVIPVHGSDGEHEWLQRVAQYAAIHLNTLFDSNMTLGIAWGTTISAISNYLLKKTTNNSRIVQLNGAGNTRTMGIEYASEIIKIFSNNYQAHAYHFPLPTFFDSAETKKLLWQERSIKSILSIQNKADILLFSIGAVNSGIPSHVHSDGYLGRKEYLELEKLDVVGDIATVFFKSNGDYKNIPLNERASGPELSFFRDKHSICVVSGLAKVKGLFAALKGQYIKELIVDEPTALELVRTCLS